MNDSVYKFVHLCEPLLTFGFGQKFADPRDGLTLFGPFTRKQFVGQVNLGVIGPPIYREYLRNYLHQLHKSIGSPVCDLARPSFPGLQATFEISVNFNNLKEIDIPQDDIDRYLCYTDGYQRVHNLCSLYTDKLLSYQKEEETPVSVWFVVIPDSIFDFGKPRSHIPASTDNVRLGLSKRDRDSGQSFLFEEMETLRGAYEYEINFHNQLKARLLKGRIVTQIIRGSTIAYREIWTDQARIDAERKFDSAKAWNIATTLYYKLGGLPWKLGAIRPKVCYLGLVYKKLHQAESNCQACCAAQMFLDSGDGVVFKGNIGPWYNPQTKEYHLYRDDARALLEKSLQTFRERFLVNSYPDEIFIHARTLFNDDEWAGFRAATDGKSLITGVRIRPDSTFKLYRDFTYSIPRGAVLKKSNASAYLWTKGFIPRLQTQLGLETPNPLMIDICRGEADISIVCRDILALTKLNYNSCVFADGWPVTLRFADRIGEVLTAGRDVECGVLTFKHYI